MIRRLFPAHLSASGAEPLHVVEICSADNQPWSIIVSLYDAGIFVEIIDRLVGWHWGEWSSFAEYPELLQMRNGDKFNEAELLRFVEGLNEA